MTLRFGLMAGVMGAALFITGCGDEKCTTDADCADNEFCEQVGGTCMPDDSQQTDNCAKPGECTAPQVCDMAAGSCVSAATCTATDTTQPDTACAYGLWCNGGTCAEAPLATTACTNYGTTGHALTWTSGSTGPVIFKIVNQATVANSTFCGTGSNFRYRITVYAYHPQANFPTTDTGIEGILHLVAPDGAEVSATNTIQDLVLTNGNATAKFTVNFCRGSTGGGGYSAGLHFTGGNEVCQQVPGP